MKKPPEVFDFYKEYQPKISKALIILGRQKYMYVLNKIRKEYKLDLGMEGYQEHILQEFLKTMRRELK